MNVATARGHGRSGAVKVRNTRVTASDPRIDACYVAAVDPPLRGSAPT